MLTTASLGAASALGADESATLAGFRRVFVTSVTGNGNFDTWPQAAVGLHGLAAADSICRNLAAAAALPNSTAYRAWLSDSNDDAWCRIQNLTGRKPSCGTLPPPPGGGPWARTDGDLAACGNLAALTGQQKIYLPNWIDETGAPIASTFAYWTGTDSDGAAYTPAGEDYCGNWDDAASGMAFQGRATHLGMSWSLASTAPCTESKRLLCFETGTGPEPPRASSVPGGLLFVTQSTGSGSFSTWALAGGQTGIAAGDAVCQAEAAAAGLPQPSGFKAIACAGTPWVFDRFPNIPWNRVDTYRVADTTTLLKTGDLRTAPNQDVLGTYHPSGEESSLPFTWTGIAIGGGWSGEDCTVWTSTAGNGTTGTPHAATNSVFTSLTYPCTQDLARLLCASDREFLFWETFEFQTLERWGGVVAGP